MLKPPQVNPVHDVLFCESQELDDVINYNFNLRVVAVEDCWDVNYRNGSCCNQTLEFVSLSMIEGAHNA